ncbi:hypothetical protein [Bradyrhizobium sp. 2TAF24]|uniref:hypothetical protein n=1 Tax=Bradyrhizobium sp. 2TAF24 TaxID=3233011 RepID=UPI003F919953
MAIKASGINAPRIHYERVVYDTLLVLWRQRQLVAKVFGIALVALLVALLFVAPRYSGEAMIKLDFVRNENIAGERVQSTAAVDAAAVVDSAARIVRSRGTAGAVVSALRLDTEADYTHLSFRERLLSLIGLAFGRASPTPYDIAVARLMKQITVTNDPRSYLITIAVTSSNPERAARLANWVGSEYLRGRLREQVTEAYAAAEREMTALSAVVGPRHPTYLNGLTKLGRLKDEMDAARRGIVARERKAVVASDMVRFAGGQTLLPADVVMVPSGPNVTLLFALTTFLALVVGSLLALLAERGMLRWPVSLPSALRGWSPMPRS